MESKSYKQLFNITNQLASWKKSSALPTVYRPVSKRASTSGLVPQPMHIGDTDVDFSDLVKNLGVALDSNLSMHQQVTNTCTAAYIELRRFSSICQYLTVDATKTLVSAFVFSRLDYCNALLSGILQYLLDRLQRVQNAAARLTVKVSKSDHIAPILHLLHWLPVTARIQYKIYSLCYSSLSHSSPEYLYRLLRIYTPSRQLH